MSAPQVELGEFIMKGGGSVNPAKYPNEVFHLYSIPAYDSGRPDEVEGSEIGSSKNVVQGNDVLLSRIVPHIRRGWIVEAKNGHRQIASGEWIIFRSERFDPAYLRYHLLSDEFNRKFMRTIKGIGGSLLRADPNQVAKFKIPLPSLPTQRRIAAVLDKAQALVANDRRTLAVYDQLAKSLFLEMFGDPVRNERGWETVDLWSLCELVRGSSPRPQGDARYFGGPVPRLMVADLTRDGMYVTPCIDSLTIEGAKHSRPMKRGDLVMAVSGKPGLPAILNVDCCIHDGFAGFRNFSTDYDLRFVFYHLNFRASEVDKKSDGAIFKNITTDEIRRMRMPVVPIKDQHLFGKRLDEIQARRGNLIASLRRSEGLFGSLLQSAFSGGLG